MTLILAGCKEWSTEQAGTWADKVLFLRISKTPTTISERMRVKKKFVARARHKKCHTYGRYVCAVKRRKLRIQSGFSVSLRISTKFQPQNPIKLQPQNKLKL